VSADVTALQRRLLEVPPWTVVIERGLSYLRVGVSGGGGAGSLGRLGHLDDEVLVVARDSDGGLGPKPADAGLGPEAVTGSTEDNVPTVATGVGVTVLGRARVGSLRAGSARAPFSVVLLGRPMSAPAELFGPDHPEVVTVPAVVAAMGVDGMRSEPSNTSAGIAFGSPSPTGSPATSISRAGSPVRWARCSSRSVTSTTSPRSPSTRSWAPSCGRTAPTLRPTCSTRR
jgi:hypothetical protein